jgi:predicted HTH transcriptional regulator
MDFNELKRLVRQGEGKNVEFKLKASHPEKLVREMIAFANSEGGWLFIGVDDFKNIKGSKFPLEDEYVLTKAIVEYASPTLKYKLYKIPIEADREVLAFFIPKSTKIHYFCENPKLPKGKAYIRVDDKSLKASTEMWEILRGQEQNKLIKFRYGDKERILLQYLETYRSITVEQYAKTANIPRKIASRTLVLLVLAKVLQIKPHEAGDSFEVVEQVL